jgi:Ca2+-binding EF-hand superfamily protein
LRREADVNEQEFLETIAQPEMLETFRKMFEQFDKDGNGRVSTNEFSEALGIPKDQVVELVSIRQILTLFVYFFVQKF